MTKAERCWHCDWGVASTDWVKSMQFLSRINQNRRCINSIRQSGPPVAISQNKKISFFHENTHLAKVALSSDTMPTLFRLASVRQYFLQSQICTQPISFRNSRTCRRLLAAAIHRHRGQRSVPDPSVETFEQWPIRMNQFSAAKSTKQCWRDGKRGITTTNQQQQKKRENETERMSQQERCCRLKQERRKREKNPINFRNFEFWKVKNWEMKIENWKTKFNSWSR